MTKKYNRIGRVFKRFAARFR